MLVRTVVSPLLGTNCHVLADDEGRCVVVDPGALVADDVLTAIRADGLTATGVLVTHGHVDHTWDAGRLAEALGVAVHVHLADLPRIADPFGTLGPLGTELERMAASAGQTWSPPRDVSPFGGPSAPAGPDGADAPADLDVGGLILTAFHAPGHTEGSTVFLTARSLTARSLALTGDVLFAGTIGRTDLPGGDDTAMRRTLSRLAGLDPATLLLPGHGPGSDLATELRTNPYLRDPR